MIVRVFGLKNNRSGYSYVRVRIVIDSTENILSME